MGKIVTFGEIMGRISPEGFYRFAQSLPGKMNFTFGGGEANVAMSLSQFGMDVAFVTALPKNAVTESCLALLRGLKIDCSHIIHNKGRLGLYYAEAGANQRASQVIYDRDYSAISLSKPEDYDFKSAFSGADWFHFTGITPAISENSAASTVASAKIAKEMGLTVSCDLNFRKKLWNWKEGTAPKDLAQETAKEYMPFVDVVIANEEDADKVLGIKPDENNVEGGKLNIAGYVDVARKIVKNYPNVKRVAISLRESYSATHNNWGGMLYDTASDKAYFAPMNGAEYAPYEIKSIVDRIGGGDSFGAGLIYALLSEKYNAPQNAISFAVAASCLKHSILGDFNYTSVSEVETLLKGDGSGRVNR